MSNPSAIVEVFTPVETIRSVYQEGSGILLGVDFTNGLSGPESFTLTFSGFANIKKRDIVKIRVFGSTDYFFTGVVRNIPIEGSSDVQFIYTGFGLSEYFGRVSTEYKEFTSELVEDIVESLLDDIITVKTPIKKNGSLIDATGVTVNSITFDYITVQEALQQLKEMAQAAGSSYITGVDEDGYFFFLQRDNEVLKTLVVGKNSDIGIPFYNPSDEDEARTKLFIKNKDGTFYSTVTSLEENDIYEETITAPDIAENDLIPWATGILIEKEVNTRKATIEWQIEKENPTFLTGNGNLRIISNIPATNSAELVESFYGSGDFGGDLFGGSQANSVSLDDTLRIISCQYIINNSEAKRIIQLGLDDPDLNLAILSIRSELKGLKISLGV